MKSLSRIVLVISTAALAAGIIVQEQWLWIILIAGNTALGFAANGSRMKSVWLFVQILIAALSGAPPVLALVTIVFGLASWDLAAFEQLIHSEDQIFGLESFVLDHRLSLLLALGTGSILALISFGITLNLNFVGAVFIALLALAGIVRLSRSARSELS